MEDIERSLVRLHLITRNARLVDARKERGVNGDTVANAIGMARTRLRRIETLKIVPTEDDMVKLAVFLEKPIDYLFPEELMQSISAGVFSKRKVDLNAPQVTLLTEIRRQELLTDGGIDEVEREVDNETLRREIDKALSTLPKRMQRVLCLRFGLDGTGSKTLEEVGRSFDVQKERIRQIEAKALRMLRHPSRSRQLKDYLE